MAYASSKSVLTCVLRAIASNAVNSSVSLHLRSTKNIKLLVNHVKSITRHSRHGSSSWMRNVALAAALIVPTNTNGQEDTIAQFQRAPVEPQPLKRRRWSLWRWLKYLWHTAGKEMLLVIVACALYIASSVVALHIPDVLGRFWDTFNSSDSLLNPIIKLAALLLARFILQALSSSLMTDATEDVAAAIRKDLFSHLLDNDMTFFDERNSSDLVSLLTEDVKEIRDFLRALFGEGVPLVAQVVGTVAKLYTTSSTLTMGLGLALPGMMVIGNLYAGRLRKLSRRNQELQAKTANTAAESLINIRTVRAFTGETEEINKYSAAHAISSESSARLGTEINRFRALVTFGLSAFGGLLLYAGGELVKQGELSRGQLASFLSQAMSLESSLESLSVISSKLLKVQGTADRIGAELERKPVINQRGGAQWPTFRGHITFKDVSFAYPSRPGVSVLKNVNIEFPAGQVVALCGPSGSGKSTIAGLLLGFYRPEGINSGVSIDGRDIGAVDLHWYREHVAYVSQDAPMFNATIRENILYGNKNASDDELRSALQAAHAEEFIAGLPEGLETRVGERGLSLSGGQRQRIALARALLRNPKILILDEYSSALDAEAEAVVQAALKEKFRDRTVVLIAHRLSTIAAADQVHVLSHGRVVESGNHHELLRKSGAYAQLVKRQSSSSNAAGSDNQTFIDTLDADK